MKALLNVRFCHRPWLISAYAYQPVFVLAPYCLTQILSIAAYDHAPPGWPELLVRGLASFVRRFKAACLLFIYGVMRLIEAALALSATRLSVSMVVWYFTRGNGLAFMLYLFRRERPLWRSKILCRIFVYLVLVTHMAWRHSNKK